MYNPIPSENIIIESLAGFYRAIVVDNNDIKKAGRVQVRVPPFFDGVLEVDLPWAIYADSFMGGLANSGGAVIPDIGSHIFVFFENGDHRYPVYFAGAPAIQAEQADIPRLSREDDGTVAAIDARRALAVPTASGGTWDEPASAYNPTYPSNKVIRTKAGIVVELDDTSGNERIHILHPSGSRTEISPTGVVEHVEGDSFKVVIGDENIQVTGTIEINAVGNIGINAVGNIEINAPAVNLTAGTTTITGDLNVTGTVDVSSGDLVSDGVSLKTHVHVISSGSSAGSTEVPT